MPADQAGVARRGAEIATGEIVEVRARSARVHSAQVGAKARAENMSKVDRNLVARKTATARVGTAFTDDKVTRIVADTIKKQLAPCEVGVHFRKSFDEEGDPLLVITVVLGTECEPDRKKMLGLVRYIRSKLDDATAAGFPLVSFVSKRDAAKMDLEAA